MSFPDDNPRPAKRQRTASLPPVDSTLAPLPVPVLLLSLPKILIHPPTHPYHAHSLCLSVKSLRQCLILKALSPEIECRAWTALAEVGMTVIDGGMSQSSAHPWARGIEQEVEKAISKGLLISQKHPSLRLYKYQLILTHARMAQWQHNHKFARTLLRRLLSSAQPSADPPALVYTAHLALIHHFINIQDTYNVLVSLQTFQTLAQQNGHIQVVLLTHVIRLHVLVTHAKYAEVPAALDYAESAFGLSYPAKANKDAGENDKYIAFADPVEEMLAVHTLILGIAYYTHAGASSSASPRLSHLHALLDTDALEKYPEGIIEIPLPTGPPLSIHMTHPRTLYPLGFLLSSVAKPDPIGRKPRRKVFTMEGLATWDSPKGVPGLLCPQWATRGDVDEIEDHLDRIKADLMSELVAISIMRSEFDTAEESLAKLIAHTRTTNIFHLYAPRITLHHAHLAHALGQSQRAATCYHIAAALADEGGSTSERDHVRAAARAGEVAIRIGLYIGTWEGDDAGEWGEIVELGKDAVAACRGMGGRLEAVGEVLEACLSPEILKSKQHLKRALALATQSQDNHLRALILAIVSAHYFHTAEDHALVTLGTADQLAVGLGAPPMKGAPVGPEQGNVPLRLWIGERYVELYKRAGKDARAEKQEKANVELRKAVATIASRAILKTEDSA